jgi:hypothetical protein
MMPTIAPISAKIVALVSSKTLKWEASPRQACTVMRPTSIVDDTPSVQALVPARRGRSGSLSRIQPTVIRRRPIERPNTMGFRQETDPDHSNPVAARRPVWTRALKIQNPPKT